MAGIDNGAILLNLKYQFKGPLAENYVLQQLKGKSRLDLRYYAVRGQEIDFVLQHGAEIIPIEVKGGEDKLAASFKKYIRERQPEAAIRLSRLEYMKNGAITNLPLYLAPRLLEFL